MILIGSVHLPPSAKFYHKPRIESTHSFPKRGQCSPSHKARPGRLLLIRCAEGIARAHLTAIVFKCENRSLLWEARDFKELAETVSERIEYYNRRRRHSRLGHL